MKICLLSKEAVPESCPWDSFYGDSCNHGGPVRVRGKREQRDPSVSLRLAILILELFSNGVFTLMWFGQRQERERANSDEGKLWISTQTPSAWVQKPKKYWSTEVGCVLMYKCAINLFVFAFLRSLIFFFSFTSIVFFLKINEVIVLLA